ncbi:MAG: cupin domain-containing protein [Nitrospirae bacterium]|nr:cupin domain-containing protein [Nitrospirota bacterium]
MNSKTVSDNSSKIIRHKENCKWKDYIPTKYKNISMGGWSDISRNVLIGERGESAKFHLRYFEINPGGCSSLEFHKHEHVVVVIKGTGRVKLGKKNYKVTYLDTIYISPYTVHQLTNPFDEPFGFFCIVNAKRDKPKRVRELGGGKGVQELKAKGSQGVRELVS